MENLNLKNLQSDKFLAGLALTNQSVLLVVQQKQELPIYDRRSGEEEETTASPAAAKLAG